MRSPFIFAFLGLLALSFGCSKKPDKKPASAIRPAKLLVVQGTTNERSLNLPAVVEAAGSVDLTFPVGGLLSELLVTGGQRVEEGAVIARLDPRSFRNNVAAAQTRYNSAIATFSRAERLLAENAVARNVYEQREAEVEVARTQLDNAKKALEDSVLISPFAGVIAYTDADQFQNVSAGAVIANLQTRGSSRAAVQIPATLVANSGSFKPLETYVRLDVAPDVRIPAKVGTTTSTSDPRTQTFSVKFDFEPPADLLVLPGMTGTVHARYAVVNGEGSTDRITIPLNAIVTEGTQRFVWIVDPDSMKVSRREITVVDGIGEETEIASGLAAGDTIVGAGASYLHEGMQIRAYQP